jgi:hypothetical protein
MTVSGSTLSGNGARDEGGGIFNSDTATVGLPTATVSGSTLSGNFAHDGGGIFNGGHLTVKDKSTVSGNHALFGFDLYEAPGGATLTVSSDSTITYILFA